MKPIPRWGTAQEYFSLYLSWSGRSPDLRSARECTQACADLEVYATLPQNGFVPDLRRRPAGGLDGETVRRGLVLRESCAQPIVIEGKQFARQLRRFDRLASFGEEGVDAGGGGGDQIARWSPGHAERMPDSGRDGDRVPGAGDGRANRAVLLVAEGQLAFEHVEALPPRIDVRTGAAAEGPNQLDQRELAIGFIATQQLADDNAAEH